MSVRCERQRGMQSLVPVPPARGAYSSHRHDFTVEGFFEIAEEHVAILPRQQSG